MIAGLVVLAVLAFGGYFWVKQHQRASLASVETKITDDELAKNVSCVKRADNGSVWWCAGLVGTKGACWIVHVPVMGDMKVKDGRSRCKQVASLAATVRSGA
jgi:hypothetical protein